MPEQLSSQDIGTKKINIPPEYLEKINLLIEKALTAAAGFIEETQESQWNKDKANKVLENPKFIEWATNRGRELFAGENKGDKNDDTIQYNLAQEIASKALMWPEQIVR